MNRNILFGGAMALIVVVVFVIIGASADKSNERVVETKRDSEYLLGFVTAVSKEKKSIKVITDTGKETAVVLGKEGTIIDSNEKEIGFTDVIAGDIVEARGKDGDESFTTPRIKVLAREGLQKITEKENGRSFYYPLSSRFSIQLPGTDPVVPLCSPEGTLEVVPSAGTASSFETAARGVCIVTSNDWTVTIQSIELPPITASRQ